MAAKIGTTADALTFLAQLEERPHDFGFYAVLRALDCLHSDKPPLGEGARPSDEPVRLGQEPSLAFAPSTLASFAGGDRDRPHRLATFFFGLFGPHGPLPLHLTEFARDRERNADDPTFRRFADVFHHRLLSLFYRAWANAGPCTSLDRATPRRFDTYVGSTFGIADATLRRRDTIPDEAKLYLAGILSLPTRPAVGLLSVLREFFRLPFTLKQFAGEWLKLPARDWCSLGVAATQLGVDMVAGRSVWSCQHKFRVVCGPLDFAQFKELLPGGSSLRRLRDLILNYVGDELDWDLNPVLEAQSVPPLKLGESGELGWTTWLGERRTAVAAADVIIHPATALTSREIASPARGGR